MLRRLSSKLHIYLGLTAGILLVPIGLTGSILVFHEEVDAALNPHLHRVDLADRRVSLDELVSLVAAQFPDEPVSRIDLPVERGAPVEMTLRGGGRAVYLDAYRGRILGSHLPGETLASAIFEFHVSLLGGEAGKQIVGWVGIMFALIGLTGIILWWRGWRRFWKGFRVRWSGGAFQVNLDVHHVVGALSVLPLAVLSFTGAGLIFYGTFDAAAHHVTATAPPAPVHSTPRSGGTPATYEEMFKRSAEIFPEARLSRLDVPAGPEGAFRVRLRMPGEMHPIGLSMVHFDQYTGALLRAENALEVPGARRLGYWYYPLHIGSFGGVVVQLMYVLAGLAPLALGCTGVWVWYGRRRKRQRKAGNGPTASANARAPTRIPAPERMPS